MLLSPYLTGGMSLVTEQACGCPIAWCTAPRRGRLCSQPWLGLCPPCGCPQTDTSPSFPIPMVISVPPVPQAHLPSVSRPSATPASPTPARTRAPATTTPSASTAAPAPAATRYAGPRDPQHSVMCPCRGEGVSAGALPCPQGSLPAGPSPFSAHHSALPSGMGQGELGTVPWHPPHSHLSLLSQGRDCEVALSGCSSNPCANGGTCQPQEGEGAGFR